MLGFGSHMNNDSLGIVIFLVHNHFVGIEFRLILAEVLEFYRYALPL